MGCHVNVNVFGASFINWNNTIRVELVGTFGVNKISDQKFNKQIHLWYNHYERFLEIRNENRLDKGKLCKYLW